MPDYDPEKIPVLDDVVADSNNTDTEASIFEEAEISQTDQQVDDMGDIVEEMPAVSTDAYSDTNPDKYSQQTTDEYAAEESIDNNNGEETTVFESALIDYDADTQVDTEANNEAETIEDNAITLSSAIETAESLEAMVADVVQQVMPELEQQLKNRVQQALEERLPQDMLQALASSTEKTEQD